MSVNESSISTVCHADDTNNPIETIVMSNYQNGNNLMPLTRRCYSKWCPSQQGATLVWRDVCVYATNTDFRCKRLKRIINNSTGAIEPGTLMALMGSRLVIKTKILVILISIRH